MNTVFDLVFIDMYLSICSHQKMTLQVIKQILNICGFDLWLQDNVDGLRPA